jgi:hypothetical protein
MDATENPVEVVQEDVPCRRCGYNLRTLPVDGQCPECGTEVRPSLRGRRLVNADRGWLAWICGGAILFGVGLVLLAISWAVLVLHGLGFNFVLLWAGLVAAACGGAWLLTPGEPDGPYFDDRRVLRRVIRTLTLIGAIPLGISLSGELTGHPRPDWRVLTEVGAILLMVAMELVPWYLASLSKRMDERWLKISGRLTGLSLPICYGMVVVIGFIGPGSGARDFWVVLVLMVCAFASPGVYALAWAVVVSRKRRMAERLAAWTKDGRVASRS